MSSRPNILFMIMDDQRADAIGALGNDLIQTPTLDRLVREGTACLNHHCSVPICTPARAEVLSGCDNWRNDVVWFGIPIAEDLPLLPRLLQENGYHTIHCGKWHNDGHPRDKGYAVTRRVFPSDSIADYAELGHTFRFREGDSEIEGHSTELIVDAALEELQVAPADQPWFCYVALHSPHDPFDCPEPYASMYDCQSFPLPPNYMPEHSFDNGDMTIRDELLLPWPRTQEVIRDYRARYYSMISHHDAQLGRLVQWLDDADAAENTLVVFTSDHGLAVGSHGLLGKENMYEHSCRVPLLFRGPGIPAGARREGLSRHPDLLPTLCQAASIPVPDVDGTPLQPVLAGDHAVNEFLAGAFVSPDPNEPGTMRQTQRMIRDRRWKLTFFPHLERYQLFDLANDPHELADLLQPWRLTGTGIWGGGSAWSVRPDPVPPGRETILANAARLREQLLADMAERADPAHADLVGAPLPA